MTAIIVDDEKKGRETLLKMVEKYCPELEVKGMAASVEEAHALIVEHQPHIVFLDIEMPGEDGFALLEKFEVVPFHVVFVTAYDHYALKAIKHNALDYLLKPIDMDDLQQVIVKLKKTPVSQLPPQRFDGVMAGRKLAYNSKLALPVKDGLIYLTVSDIIRIESDGSYSTFYTSDAKKYVVSRNLKEYEDALPVTHFFRSHKSHVINIYRVKKYLRTDGYFVEMEDGSVVEIARRKKDEFLQLMGELG
jgi:two-component system LytT family response regulator